MNDYDESIAWWSNLLGGIHEISRAQQWI